jgi:short subunit dehydrogenase-like uncharacterized protein
MISKAGREFDIIVLGATGFVGELIAEYLTSRPRPGAKLALAGRNRAKLEAVAGRLGTDVALITVDATDPEAMAAVARRTRVLITTVGPYILHGRPVVAACAGAGTDYLDLTGEPEFVDLTYLKHHARAVATGARLVHACGFDSVPHDLGAQFTVEQLPQDVPLTVRGYVRASGTFSGGTVASALEIMSRLRSGRATRDLRRALDHDPPGRTTRIVNGRIGRDRDTGWWVVPMPTLDPAIVTASARLLPRYGPDFSYSHFWASTSPLSAAAMVGGAGAIMAAAQIPAARRALGRRLPPGSGPSIQKRENSWFKVRFFGQGAGTTVVTEVAGGDPGYTETATMISEAALCLAFDDLPATSGQVTTASCMGPALRSRLEQAGITFSVLSSSSPGVQPA